MAETTLRALKLLSLLQTHRHWTGTELGERLGITERTVRRDVDRLRGLGYRIESTPGAAGGYRLEAGNALPPLLLDDDEAVTIAIGLRVAATQQLVDGAHTSLSALAKLEQVLPPALRRRVGALADVVQPVGFGGPLVSPDVLGELALSCRDHERIRFDYTARDGAETHRRVEPHTLAAARRSWYLVAWDLEREAWRTFRVDRISRIQHLGARFAPRELAPADVDELVRAASSYSPQRFEASVVMGLGLAAFEEHFGEWGRGATAAGEARTRWPIAGADFREAMYALSYIPEGIEYETDLPEPHRSELLEVLERMVRALKG